MTPKTEQIAARSRRIFAGAAALLVALTLLAHLPLRESDYVQDDHLAVERNDVAQRGRLAEILATSYWRKGRVAFGNAPRPFL